jgi:hypothetical protein
MGTKMGTVTISRFWIASTRLLQIENANYISRYWNEASPEKAGVGGSIPSLATI